VFVGTPVPEALATIGRWYDLDVRLASLALASQHVTSTFANATADEALASLAAALDARVERHGRAVTLVPMQATSHE